MRISGLEGLTQAEVAEQLRRGARFVVFDYVISLCLITFRRSSEVIFVPAGKSVAAASLPYCLLSFFFGWWGFPFGLFYTPLALVSNLTGGRDVTRDFAAAFTGGGTPTPVNLPE